MYAKIFAQIYDGTLCTQGPWQALVTFQQILVLADQHGVVDMTASAISRRTTIPIEIINEGIEALLRPDPDSRTPTEEGRRIVPLSEGRPWGWRVVNYEHYRQLKREEDRREYHAQYYREKRSPNAKKGSADPQQGLNSIQHPQQIQPNTEANAEAYANAERKKPPAKRATPAVELTRPDDVSAQTWADWLKLRKSKRAPVTATVLNGARSEAHKAGMELEAFLQVWCRRGSQGLEAEWLKPTELKQSAQQPLNKQTALEERNRAVAEEWLRQQEQSNASV